MTKNTPTVKIIVATHKKYEMPQDAMYLPLHVGAEGKTDQNGNPLDLGYQKDNTGENISNKNAAYCELTGLYWAWKNLDTDYTGLAHYRRHFGKKTKAPFEGVLTYNELRPMLEKYKIFVPKKRKYYIETLYSHYEHTHYASDIFVLVGKCILGKENAEKFRILRKKAEFEAREENNHKEITLDQIYEKLRGLYEEDVIEQLRKEEIQQEIKHCHRKENIAPLYQACVKKKKHILIISDMYLPSEVIQKMLKACNILDYEKIYVSNEYGVNKISGILFKKVIQDKKINAYEMIHIGDSIKADFLGARKARVKSVLIGRKNRFERLIHS